MKKITIYTDGACSGNPGPGGWGAVILYKHHKKEINGFVPDTTNNRMELTAAIKALDTLKEPCDVELYTDSIYVKKGITEWIVKWRLNNFSKIKNAELWQELDAATKGHKISWRWVKGHNGHPLNERADYLARSAIV